MLDIKDLVKVFYPGTVNETHAINGISLHINKGDVVSLIGSNGSGKSTLLNLIAEKLKLNRIAPYNSSEMFASYVGNCELELVMMLEEMARYCGCQFVIATHSPFLLALDGARIYDLDSKPIKIREWWELENTRLYFEFFEKNRHLFQK